MESRPPAPRPACEMGVAMTAGAAVGENVQGAPQEAGGRSPSIGLVSVIVPHLDDYDNLDACLTLLADQSFPNGRTEIIVADNGSSRGLDAVRRIVGTDGRARAGAALRARTNRRLPHRSSHVLIGRVANRRDRILTTSCSAATAITGQA